MLRRMLFLLNDTVLNLSALALTPPVTAHRFRALSHGFVEQLGRELFAEQPLLHRRSPEQARRLASLIVAKTPEVNAALFIAPKAGCAPSAVEVRYANLGFEVICDLASRQSEGRLSMVECDRAVWRRLAA